MRGFKDADSDDGFKKHHLVPPPSATLLTAVLGQACSDSDAAFRRLSHTPSRRDSHARKSHVFFRIASPVGSYTFFRCFPAISALRW